MSLSERYVTDFQTAHRSRGSALLPMSASNGDWPTLAPVVMRSWNGHKSLPTRHAERKPCHNEAVRLSTSEDYMRNTTDAQTSADQILMLERSALDRWGNGDPGGFLELYADDITYFDPAT